MHNLPQAAGADPPRRDLLPGRVAAEPAPPVDVLGAWVLLPVLPSTPATVAGASDGAAPNRADPS